MFLIKKGALSSFLFYLAFSACFGLSSAGSGVMFSAFPFKGEPLGSVFLVGSSLGAVFSLFSAAGVVVLGFAFGSSFLTDLFAAGLGVDFLTFFFGFAFLALPGSSTRSEETFLDGADSAFAGSVFSDFL